MTQGPPEGPVYAVGGYEQAALWRIDSAPPEPIMLPEGSPALNGISYAPAGWAAAVGQRGSVLWLPPGGSWEDAQRIRLSGAEDRTLHAAWAGAALWVVGGDLERFERGLIGSSVAQLPRIEPW